MLRLVAIFEKHLAKYCLKIMQWKMKKEKPKAEAYPQKIFAKIFHSIILNSAFNMQRNVVKQ